MLSPLPRKTLSHLPKPPVQVTPPAWEPVDISAVFTKVKLVTGQVNQMSRVAAARVLVEGMWGRAVVRRTLEVWFNVIGPPFEFKLPSGPVNKIVGVYSYSEDNVESVVDSITYTISRYEPTTIRLKPAEYLTSRKEDGVKVVYDVGHLTPVLATTTGGVTTFTALESLLAVNGAPVKLTPYGSAPLPSPLQRFTSFYMTNVNAAGGTFQLEEVPGAGAIALGTSGTAKLFLGEYPEAIQRAIEIAASADMLTEGAKDGDEVMNSDVPERVRSLVRSVLGPRIY